MEIPVVRRLSRQEFEIVMLDLNDVLFTFVENSVIKYQTKNEVFSQISTLEEQERFLSTMGFKKLERGYLVQMDKVEWYDEETHQVFFEPYPSKKAPSAPVSRVHRKDVPEGLIVKQNARSYPRGLYSPLER
jgi:DNA-binding LytR/AlgR family response regulator